MKCPLCNNKEYKELNYGGYFYKNKKMPLVKCRNCSLKYIIHNLSIKEIKQLYNEPTYFDSEYGGGADKKYIENKAELDKKAINILNLINKHKKNCELLEIGCAGGYFLNKAKKCGYKVTGIELSKEMVNFARNIGLKVYQGEISNLPKDIKFDIIYLGDVMEHVANTNKLITQIKNRLNKYGLIIIELPLTYNLTFSGIFIGIFNIIKGRISYKYFLPAQHRTQFIEKPPYHLLMFNRRSILELARINNLRISYLRLYDGFPKNKFKKNMYYLIKQIGYFLTSNIPQTMLGDRAIIIARKIYV